MIMKNLSALAGSILIASNAQSAIVAGSVGYPGPFFETDSSAILVLSRIGQGTYVYDTGFSASELLGVSNFSIDISAASAALGGSIDHFALFGVVAGSELGFNYNEFTYFDINGGIVYTKPPFPVPSIHELRLSINDYIGEVSVGGYFAESSAGDLHGTSLGDLLLSPRYSGITTRYRAGLYRQFRPDETEVIATEWLGTSAQLTGNSFEVNPVPIPATAWLFLSALFGMVGLKHQAYPQKPL